jgi:hypothetical protein
MEQSSILIYQTEDGKTKIETRLQEETVWLTIDQMSELFHKSQSTVNEHILNIYAEGELAENTSMRKIGNPDFSIKLQVSEHVKNLFEEIELDINSVVRNFRTTAADGKSYDTNFYNLDVRTATVNQTKSTI